MVWMSATSMLLLLTGCGESGQKDNPVRSGVFEEMNGEIARGAVKPEDRLLFHLEANSQHEGDTEGVGYDSYKLHIETPHMRTFCFENDQNRSHRLSIADASGKEIASLSNGCADVSLPSGDLTVRLYNGDADKGIAHQVFVLPEEDYSDYQGALDAAPAVQKAAGRSAQQSALVKTKIVFDRCDQCNLEGLDLSHMTYDRDNNENYFDEMNTTLRDHYFRVAGIDSSEIYAKNFKVSNHKSILDLSGSDLRGADLSYGVFSYANFEGVDFKDANLSHAVFMKCRFDGAKLDNADLLSAVFINQAYGTSGFAPNASLQWQAVSTPSATMLFRSGQASREGQFASALLDKRHLLFSHAVYNENLGHVWTRTIIDDLEAESPPVTVPNNFDQGRSTYIKLSDGYVYNHFEPIGVYDNKNRIFSCDKMSYTSYNANNPSLWCRVDGAEQCASSLSAFFENFMDNTDFGTGPNNSEMTSGIVCQGYNNKIHVFSTRFFNRWDDNGGSYYNNKDEIDSSTTYDEQTECDDLQTLSINSHGQYACIQSDGNLYLGYLTTWKGAYDGPRKESSTIKTPADITRSGSSHVFSMPSRASNDDGVAVVMTQNGENDLYYSTDLSSFDNAGHPENVTIVSAPSYHSGFNFSRTPCDKYKNCDSLIDQYPYIAVLGSDGQVWRYEIPQQSWVPFGTNEYADPTYTPKNREVDYSFSGMNAYGSWFQSEVFSYMNFTDARLDKTFFIGDIFKWSGFKGAELNSTVFYQADLSSTDFSTANGVEDLNITSSNLNGTIFKGLIIGGMNIENSYLENVDFSGLTFEINASYTADGNTFKASNFQSTKHVPVNLFYGKNDLERNASVLRFHDFTEATFDGLETLDFIGADMTGARMAGVKIKHMDLNGLVWSGAVMSGMVFDSCSFKSARLDTNDSGQIRFTQCNLAQAYLKGKYTSAHFDNSDLSGISVDDGTQMNLAHFTSTTMSLLLPATMKGVNLNAAAFSGVEFYKTDFTAANLGNIFVDSNSKFIECDFSNALVGSSSLDGNSLFGGSCFTKCENKCWGEKNVSFLKSGQTQFHQMVWGIKTEGPLEYNLSTSCSSGTYKP